MNGTVLFGRTTIYDTTQHDTENHTGLSAYYTKQELDCTRTVRDRTEQDGTTTHDAL